MADLFISYSREDSDMARRLQAKLTEEQRDVWIDWEALPATAEWWKKIRDAILASDNFLIIISPNSIASPLCHLEIACAIELHKRMVPIKYRDIDETEAFATLVSRPLADFQRALLQDRDLLAVARDNWQVLAGLSWIDFTDDASFQEKSQELLNAIDADAEYVGEHTRLLVQATDWDNMKRSPDRLLRGDDLTATEAWLEDTGDKSPQPTALQRDYVTESRRMEDDERAHKRQLDRHVRQFRRAAALLGVVGILAVGLAIGASLVGLYVQNRAHTANTQVAVADVTLAAGQAQATAVAGQVQEGEARVQSLNLAAQAVETLNGERPNAELAALLGIRALNTFYTPQAETALRVALPRLRIRQYFAGHTAEVLSVAYSPDGRTVLTGSADNTARLWDAASGKLLHTFIGHAVPVTSVAFSPDGRTVLTGSQDTTARLWDAQSGKLLHILAGHTNAVASVAFSPDGHTVLTGSQDGTARLWDVTSGELLHTLKGHISTVASVAFSPDGLTVLTGSFDYTARLWDAQNGRLLHALIGHTEAVTGAVFSPDGRTVLTGSSDYTARLWDVASGKLLHVLEGHADYVASVAFSPDGRTVLTGSVDKTARLWDAQSGDLFHVLEGHTNWIDTVAYSPDGRTVLTAGADHTARLWDVASGARLRTLEGHTGNVVSVAFSPDGRSVLTGSLDTTARLWDVVTGDPVQSLDEPGGMVLCAAFSPDGRTVLTGNGDNTAELWDVASGKLLHVLAGHTAWVNSVAYSPDGRTVLTGSADHTARLWDAASGELLHTLKGHGVAVTSVAFSPDGRIVITASADSSPRLWDAASGRPLHLLVGHANAVMSVAFSPDGRTVLTGSTDHTARLWDVASGDLLHTLKGHTSWAQTVAYSPDGRTVLTGSTDTTARLWDAASGDLLHILAGHTDQVNSVAYSPDGRTVLTGSSDTTARLWDVASGELLHILEGHTDQVNSVAFSPDGRTVLTGSSDTTARLWDAASGQLLYTLEGHTWPVLLVAFGPDGRYALTSSMDHSARVWFMGTPQELVDRACEHVFRDFTIEERAHYGIMDDAPTCPQFKVQNSRIYDRLIAFSAGFYEGHKDIFTIDLRDRSVTQLMVSGENYYPSWSPDGCRIAFESYRGLNPDGTASVDVYEMNADGTNEIQLTHDGGRRPVWSPDGTKIAYIRLLDGNGAIYIARVDGSEILQLTSYAADNGTRGLAWSPDGRWMAFISNRDNPHYDIFVVDVNAALQHDHRALTTNLTRSTGVCPAEYENLSWSPTGDRLAYSSACEGVTIDVYVMTLQETENGLTPTDEKNLTHSNVRDGLYGLDWSPDGTSLMYVSLLDFAPTTDMVVANVDKSIAGGKAIVGFKLLDGAQSGYIYYYPTWAPRRCSD